MSFRYGVNSALPAFSGKPPPRARCKSTRLSIRGPPQAENGAVGVEDGAPQVEQGECVRHARAETHLRQADGLLGSPPGLAQGIHLLP